MLGSKNNRLTFIDWFAGVGGFRCPMEAAGFQCIFSCEIDPFCRKVYKRIHRVAVSGHKDAEVSRCDSGHSHTMSLSTGGCR